MRNFQNPNFNPPIEIYLNAPENGGSKKLRFYFITTDHLSKRIWFKDDQDFKVGMNYIAIISLVSGIKVLAFILMSNHVHFVLQSTYEEAEWFINEYKRRYSEYLHFRYGTDDFLRRNKYKIQEVFIEDESLERVIAYIIMNCVAANICLTATEYPWSSAGAYFRATPPKGKAIGTLSRNARRRILHTNSILPGDALLGEYGYILPESYMPIKFVEAIFRTPKRLNYFMLNSSKAKKRIDSMNSRVPSFKDQVIEAAIPDICRSLFRKNGAADLAFKEMKELVQEVRRRFSADVNQIARVVGVEYSDVVNMLEDF